MGNVGVGPFKERLEQSNEGESLAGGSVVGAGVVGGRAEVSPEAGVGGPAGEDFSRSEGTEGRMEMVNEGAVVLGPTVAGDTLRFAIAAAAAAGAATGGCREAGLMIFGVTLLRIRSCPLRVSIGETVDEGGRSGSFSAWRRGDGLRLFLTC